MAARRRRRASREFPVDHQKTVRTRLHHLNLVEQGVRGGFLLDLFVARRIAGGVELFAAGENLLDADVVVVADVAAIDGTTHEGQPEQGGRGGWGRGGECV